MRLRFKWIRYLSGYVVSALRNPSKKLDTVNPLLATISGHAADRDPIGPCARDAERNRQRILDAARELFAEEGLGVTLNDIAHHAGVGVGTVYRRFPDKTELIEELFEQRLEDLVSPGQPCA